MSTVAMWLLRTALELKSRPGSFRFSITWCPECSWEWPWDDLGGGVMGTSPGYFRA